MTDTPDVITKEEKDRRTGSRELSTLMVLFLGYLAAVDKVEALGILVWPFIIFVTASFGFKQKVLQRLVESKMT